MGNLTPDKESLTKTPWRKLERHGSWTKEYADKLLGDIQSHYITTKNVSNINILLLGSSGAGKSSFLNTIATIDIRRLAQVAAAGAAADGSFTPRLKEYRPQRTLKNFQIFDTMGLADNDEDGLNLKDVLYLVKGHIKPNYRFNPATPIDENSREFRPEPRAEEKIHCVAFVMDVTVVGNDNISGAYRRKLNELRTVLKTVDIPRIVLLTKIDLLYWRIASDISYCYESEALRKAVYKVSDLFKVPESCVFPVKNYSVELYLDPKNNILTMLALRQMLHLGMDFIEEHSVHEEISSQILVTNTKLKENDASNNNTENYSNLQINESHSEVFPTDTINADEKDDMPKLAETETQLLVDFVNFHEFKGIFL